MTLTQTQRAIVVDASIAIPMLERDPTIFDMWRGWVEAGDMVLAPSHFPFEVANGLLRSSTVVSADEVPTLIERLFATGLDIAGRGLRGLTGAIALARRHELTVYDAAYLNLAIDVDGELATRDRALVAAAKAEGVPVLD